MIKKNGGIFGRNPTYNDVVVEGVLTLREAQVFDNDITINGDLTVNGTTTTINTVNLDVDDKNISMGVVTAKVGLVAAYDITAGQYTVGLASTVGLLAGMSVTKTAGTGAFGAGARIASVDSATQITLTVAHATSGSITFDTSGATDYTADGGGITLKGSTDKTIIWDRAKTAWLISDQIETAGITLTGLTASKVLFTDSNKKLTSTGTVAINQGGTGATTEADARTSLGLGSAAVASTSDFAPAAQGVTNGNSHDHNGGDGGQIAYASLSGLPSLGTIASQAANNVTLTGGTIDGINIGGTSAGTAKFTLLDVDNIRVDGNTISSTNTNGDITISPNGTGLTKVAGGSNDRVLSLSTTATTGYSSGGLNKGILQLVGGGATNAIAGIEFSSGGSNQMFFGAVKESGGAATVVIQGYNGTNYRGRFSWISTGQWTSTSQLTGTYSATAANSTNASGILYGQNGTGKINGLHFSAGGNNENFMGFVQESGGAGAFVVQGYNGSAYIERFRSHGSGGMSIGSATDPGAGNLLVSGRTVTYYDASYEGAGTTKIFDYVLANNGTYLFTVRLQNADNVGFAPGMYLISRQGTDIDIVTLSAAGQITSVAVDANYKVNATLSVSYNCIIWGSLLKLN